MAQQTPQHESRMYPYALPVLAGAAAGYGIGRWVGIGGLAGLLIGAFVVDAFRDLRGSRQIAAEMRDLYRILTGWLRSRVSKSPDAGSASGASERPADRQFTGA